MNSEQGVVETVAGIDFAFSRPEVQAQSRIRKRQVIGSINRIAGTIARGKIGALRQEQLEQRLGEGFFAFVQLRRGGQQQFLIVGKRQFIVQPVEQRMQGERVGEGFNRVAVGLGGDIDRGGINVRSRSRACHQIEVVARSEIFAHQVVNRQFWERGLGLGEIEAPAPVPVLREARKRFEHRLQQFGSQLLACERERRACQPEIERERARNIRLRAHTQRPQERGRQSQVIGGLGIDPGRIEDANFGIDDLGKQECREHGKFASQGMAGDADLFPRINEPQAGRLGGGEDQIDLGAQAALRFDIADAESVLGAHGRGVDLELGHGLSRVGAHPLDQIHHRDGLRERKPQHTDLPQVGA